MIGQIFWLYYKALQTYALATACESADLVKAQNNFLHQLQLQISQLFVVLGNF